MQELASSPIVRAIGVALVHFVWQGAAIALATALVLKALGRRSPSMRYLSGCVALALMAMAPVLTAVVVLSELQAPAALADPTGVTSAGAPRDLSALGRSVAAGAPWDLATWQGVIDAWLPSIVLTWALGVLAMAGRLGFAWRNIARIRRHRLAAITAPLAAGVTRVRRAMGFQAPLAVAESTMVDAPTVVGWWRPVLLMPVGIVAGLSPNQLDAILAHELAHVRRWDHLVNGLQAMVETALFYHPAVWWVSAQVRREREHCCDDLAVAVAGDRLTYVTALASIEEWRQHTPAVGLAATGGNLLARVQRILGVPMKRQDDLVARGSVGALLGVLVLAGMVLASAPAPQPTGEPPVRQTDGAGQDGAARLRDEWRQTLASYEERLRSWRTAEASAPQVETEVATADAQFRTAVVNRSATTLNALLADEFISTDQAGLVDNKTSFIGRVGTLGLTGITPQSRSVQMSGDLAIVTGSEVEVRGLQSSERVLFTRIWKRSGTTWRLVSSTQFRDPRAATVPGRTAAPTSALPGRVAPAPQPPPPPPLPPAPPSGVVRDAGDARGPVKIRDVRPVYPAIARAAGVSGVVILEAEVTGTGDVANVRVLRGHPMLDQAAIDAVQQWKYQPTTRNGVPVSVMVTVTLSFQVPPASAPPPSETILPDGGARAITTAPTQDQPSYGPVIPPPPPPPPGTILRVGGDIKEPRKIRDVRPIYPEDAKTAGVSGVVILEAVIGEAGDVVNVRVLRGNPLLNAAAIDAVQQWQYQPTTLNGVPVQLMMAVTVNFLLQ